MQRYFWAVLVSVILAGLSAAGAYAADKEIDVVYLKDGTILRGEIVEEKTDSIVIEGKDFWKEIDRQDVLKMRKEKVVEPTTAVASAAPQPREREVVIQKDRGLTGWGVVGVVLTVIFALSIAAAAAG